MAAPKDAHYYRRGHRGCAARARARGPTASGGSPRISIPIDEDGDGATENDAFVDTLGCSDGPGYANWAAFAIAHPTWTVSDDVPFVIVDQPGLRTVSNVQLGQGEDANVATAKDECKNGGRANLTRADDSSFKNQGDCIQYVNTGK